MFKKIIAALRGSTSPAPKGGEKSSSPTKNPPENSPKKRGQDGRRSDGPKAEGERRPRKRREVGPKPEGGGEERPQREPSSEGSREGNRGGEGRPRSDRPRGDRSRGDRTRGARNRGGPNDRSSAPVRERPKRDDFEHPHSESIKPKTPVDIPPQDTAFSKIGLNDALAFSVAQKGYEEPTPIQAQSIPLFWKAATSSARLKRARARRPRSHCRSCRNWARTGKCVAWC